MLCTAIAGLKRSNMAKLQDLKKPGHQISQHCHHMPLAPGPMESHGMVTLPLP